MEGGWPSFLERVIRVKLTPTALLEAHACVCLCLCVRMRETEREVFHFRLSHEVHIILTFSYNMLMFWTSTVIIIIHIPLQGFCRPIGLFFITVCPYSVYVKVWICELALCAYILTIYLGFWSTFNRKRQAYSWLLVSFCCGLVFNVKKISQVYRSEYHSFSFYVMFRLFNLSSNSGLMIILFEVFDDNMLNMLSSLKAFVF